MTEETQQNLPNIHQRMAKVMEQIDYVQKENKKVNNQYTFVSHDAVTAKVRQHFVKYGIIAITRVTGHTQDGNRTEVDIEVDFVNIDNPEDKITVPCFGYGIDPQDKGPGKAISYAVKYAYLKVLALETGDDPEKDSINHKTELEQNIDKFANTIKTIKDAIATNDLSTAAEAWYELSKEEMQCLWIAPTKGGPFTTKEREIMKSTEFREAHFQEAS